jgi:transposase-like protein
MTLPELMAQFSDDASCRGLLESLRWPEGPKCIRCGGRVARRREILRCNPCAYEFRVTAGTIFADTKLPLEKWFLAVLLIVEARKGISANQLKRTIGVSYKTAWYLCHRIRAAMASAGPSSRVPDNDIVLGVRLRNGEVRFFHIEDVESGALATFVKECAGGGKVDVIIKDNSSKAGSRHRIAKSSTGVYVEGDIHTGKVESAISLLKRGIVGSWHKISAKHLARYLAEMEFRFNRRKGYDLFLETLRHMVTADPLSFAELVR